MNAHVQVGRVAVESNPAAPYDLDADGQPIMRSDAEKFATLKAGIEAAIARGGAHTSEDVRRSVERTLRRVAQEIEANSVSR